MSNFLNFFTKEAYSDQMMSLKAYQMDNGDNISNYSFFYNIDSTKFRSRENSIDPQSKMQNITNKNNSFSDIVAINQPLTSTLSSMSKPANERIEEEQKLLEKSVSINLSKSAEKLNLQEPPTAMISSNLLLNPKADSDLIGSDKASPMKVNKKNVFLKKITNLLTDESLLSTINEENGILKEKIQTHFDIIRTESNPNQHELTKSIHSNKALCELLDSSGIVKKRKSSNEINLAKKSNLGIKDTPKKKSDIKNSLKKRLLTEDSHQDDELLGKRVNGKMTNVESARNSRKRKRLYIELIEEKLMIEQRKNELLSQEIESVKSQNALLTKECEYNSGQLNDINTNRFFKF